MTEPDQNSRAIDWFYLDHFGFSKAPPRTDAEVVRNMAVALITAASGDGILSPEERRWILGYFSAKGYPPVVVDEMSDMSPADIGALPDLMGVGILKQSARILVYDAIRASCSDGYTDGERATVRKAATVLGIDEFTVADLEQLVMEEQVLKARRIAMLMPQGHPNLDARYQPKP